MIAVTTVSRSAARITRQLLCGRIPRSSRIVRAFRHTALGQRQQNEAVAFQKL